MNNVLFEQLHLLEPSMCQYLFLINDKEFQAPQNCSSPAVMNSGKELYFEIKNSFFYHLK